MLTSPIQETEWDCGIVAARYFVEMRGVAWRLTLSSAAAIGLSTPEAGTPHHGLLRLLQYHGIHCNAATLASISDARIPSIVNYQSDGDGHYGVIVAKTDGQVFVFDPADGTVKSFGIGEFDAIFYSLRYGPRWAVAAP